jgi:hypothetical protein
MFRTEISALILSACPASVRRAKFSGGLVSLKSIGLLAALLTAAALPAAADTYSASTNPNAFGCPGVLGGDRVHAPTAASVACADGRTASSAATPGQVHATAHAPGNGGASASATFTGSVTFLSPTGNDTTVQFLIPLDGTLSRTFGGADLSLGENPNTVSVVTGVDALFALDGADIEHFDRTISTDSFGAHDNSGAFGFFDFIGNPNSDNLNLILVTRPFVLQTNVAHSFTFRLQVGTVATGVNQSASVDFSQTFGFKPGFRPFILQNGITANAGDYIVNNVVVDPNASPGGVPEPATWAVMLLGFGGIGARLRRSRRRSAARASRSSPRGIATVAALSAATALAACAGSASATTITFEDQPSGTTYATGGTLIEGDYALSMPSGVFYTWNNLPCSPACSGNGTVALYTLKVDSSFAPFTLSRSDQGLFDFSSLDAAPTARTRGPGDLAVVGLKSDNSTVTANLSTPDTGGFTSFDLSGFTGLSKVTFSSTRGYALDNLVVAASAVSVPEPAGWALMILGFGGVGAALRRRRAAVVA